MVIWGLVYYCFPNIIPQRYQIFTTVVSRRWGIPQHIGPTVQGLLKLGRLFAFLLLAASKRNLQTRNMQN